MSTRAQQDRKAKRILKAKAEAGALVQRIATLDLMDAEKHIRRNPPSTLAIAWLGYLTHIAYAGAEQTQKQSKAARARHSAPAKRARELAEEFRALKPNDKIGEGVCYVATGLKQEGFHAYKEKTIHGWIRDYFPAHLRKRGRPHKA